AAIRHQTHDTLEEDDHDSKTVSLYATPQALVEKLNDNLDTPQVMALIDEAFSLVESYRLDQIHRHALINLIEKIDELLGLELLASTPDISDEQKQLIITRERTREEKDYKESDRIRDELLKTGIALRDTSSGVVWEY